MQAKGIGPRALARALDRLGREQLSLHEFVGLAPNVMSERSGLTKDQARLIHENEETAERIAEQLDERRVRSIRRGTSAYPARLDDVLGDNAPPVLFVAGAAELLNRRGVGFCGSRDASELALRCCDQVARALVEHHLLVVSGHAAGVDETAHRAALDAGGNTALVLPEGILRFRPRSAIRELMTDENAVSLSEYSPNAAWSVGNAMQRNRTICGLVHALIVIEAGTTGGTWEAGLTALQLGVPLFVLEYSEPAASGKGNPLLVEKGGVPLPCRPRQSPDLTRLLEALELTMPVRTLVQPTLFDQLAFEE